jgi:hypothetical protein
MKGFWEEWVDEFVGDVLNSGCIAFWDSLSLDYDEWGLYIFLKHSLILCEIGLGDCGVLLGETVRRDGRDWRDGFVGESDYGVLGSGFGEMVDALLFGVWEWCCS